MSKTKKTNMIQILLLAPLSIFISLSTLFGVVIHETQMDKLTTKILAVPVVVAVVDGSQNVKTNDPHTHVERVTLSSAVRNMQASSPRIHIRGSDDKKYLLQKNVVRGHHPFDNYNLPIVA